MNVLQIWPSYYNEDQQQFDDNGKAYKTSYFRGHESGKQLKQENIRFISICIQNNNSL